MSKMSQKEPSQNITIRPNDTQFGVPATSLLGGLGGLAHEEWYTIWRKQHPIIVHKEDSFQPQDRFAFSPLPSEPISLEGAVLALLILKLSKTPEGMKSLERIAIKYMDSCARIVESIQDASHSNWLTALNNQHMAAAISHRIGLIDDGAYIKILDHYRSVFDKMFGLAAASEVMEATVTGVTTLVQGSKVSSKEGMSGLPAALLALKGIM